MGEIFSGKQADFLKSARNFFSGFIRGDYNEIIFILKNFCRRTFMLLLTRNQASSAKNFFAVSMICAKSFLSIL